MQPVGAPTGHSGFTLSCGWSMASPAAASGSPADADAGAGRRARGPRKPGCTRPDPRRPAYPVADAPNRVWVAGLTQHVTGEGLLYVAVVLDVFSRMLVGWAMGERPVRG